MKSLDALEADLLNQNKFTKKIKIIIASLIIVIIILIAICIVITFYFTISNNKGKKEEKEEKEEKNNKSEEEYLLEINGFKEEWYDIYGNRTINISYLENDIIPNTFKQKGKNYIEELGEINEGKDYTKHDVNVYDLYVPHSALTRKDKHNGVS